MDHLTVFSPIGPLLLTASPDGLCGVELLPQAPCTGQDGGSPLLEQAAAELEEYFAGTRREFTVPLDLRGTPFQRSVWKALRRIPYGKTASYAQIASAVGRPRACRAVGMACHRNPVLLFVPCHRVVASDGSLGGFACGLPAKQFLLHWEQSYASAHAF